GRFGVYQKARSPSSAPLSSSKQCISHAVATILGAHAAGFGYCVVAHAQQAPASTRAEGPSSEGGLQEVVVTAQRRVENIQDVPIAVQVLTGETLAKLNVAALDDAIKYMPNVTTSGSGPG